MKTASKNDSLLNGRPPHPPPGNLSLCSPGISESEFKQFRTLIYERSGINLSDGKKELVRARLLKRMRLCGLTCFRDYYQQVLADDSGQELVYLLDAISTNQTFFFREAQHFDFLTRELLPLWLQNRPGRQHLRFWSAGCSSGEEPYTLAMVLLEFLSQMRPPWEFSILASDLSTRVLDQARQAVYPETRITHVPPPLLKKYFQRGVNRQAGFVRLKPEVRNHIEFIRLNLMEPFPFREPFDLIFCRNVMIYFDKPTQATLVRKYHQILKPGGFLCIGHSESLSGVEHPFTYRKPTIYQK